MPLLLRFVVAWLINAAALWVCDWLFDGVRIDGWAADHLPPAPAPLANRS